MLGGEYDVLEFIAVPVEKAGMQNLGVPRVPYHLIRYLFYCSKP
jgi:hypothetical protein